MIPGETVHSGAQQICFKCETFLPFKVLHTPAGYYIGCFCDQHGPHSRETSYYSKRRDAELDLAVILLGCKVETLRE